MQWPKNMQLIDANVILRCLLNDQPDMTEKAKEVINNGAYTKPEIIAEVVYVLQKVYSVQRPQIKEMDNSVGIFRKSMYVNRAWICCKLVVNHLIYPAIFFPFYVQLNLI